MAIYRWDKRKCYNDLHTLSFDRVNHEYFLEDVKLDSVTQILQTTPKKWMARWVAKRTVDFVEDIYDRSLHQYPDHKLGSFPMKHVLLEAKKQHEKDRNEAADIGTLVHSWASRWIKAQIRDIARKTKPSEDIIGESVEKVMDTKPEDVQALRCVNTMIDIFKDLNVTWVSSERRVCSFLYMYAGTMDAEAIINGKLFLIDFKSSNHMDDSYALQTAAYQNCIKEEFGISHYARLIFRFDKNKPFEPNKDLIMYTDFRNDFKAFKAAIILHKELKRLEQEYSLGLNKAQEFIYGKVYEPTKKITDYMYKSTPKLKAASEDVNYLEMIRKEDFE